MKFIVKMVSIQHSVLIPTGALLNKTKRQSTEWEKISANDISDKGLVSKSIKNSHPKKTTPKKQIIQWRNGQKTWIDTSLKKTSTWPIGTWKDAQCHSSSGKNKSKPHWDTTSCQSEWLKWTNQETIDAGEDVEKREPSCTVGGNTNWCSHSGKVWKFLKKLKIDQPYDLVIALLGIDPRDTGVLM